MSYFYVLPLSLCLEWNNGWSYFTPWHGDRRLSTFAFTSSRGDVHCSRRESTCLRQPSGTVVCIQRVAARYFSPDTL